MVGLTGPEGLLGALDARLQEADAALEAGYPGDPGTRQPVHTVYVPADRYDAGTVAAFGREAAGLLDACAAATGIVDGRVVGLVRAKLAAEPVEDLRVDLEDGYGTRPDEQEDEHARSAARTLAAAVGGGGAPPYVGVRVKSLERATRARGVRTLALVVAELAAADALAGPLADRFVVTLPKVTSVDQVEAMAWLCGRLEAEHALPAGRLRFEIQVETPQTVLGPDGTALVARMVHAAAGRCTGLHYGTYDYSAACGIAAAYQSMEHPAADHAKAVMQVAAAGTGVRVCDGSSNVLPVGEAAPDAWRLHARLVRRSLERGFYQGWDLHPAQLPSRFLATYAFYREGLTAATARLRAYVEGGTSTYLDEPATAAALAGFLLRGVECGAVEDAEVTGLTGVDRRRLAALARRRADEEKGD